MYINITDTFSDVETVTYESLENSCNKLGIKISFVKARCQHGHKNDESCTRCEYGYSDTQAAWGRFREFPMVAALLDDGSEIAYLTGRRAEKWMKARDSKEIIVY